MSEEKRSLTPKDHKVEDRKKEEKAESKPAENNVKKKIAPRPLFEGVEGNHRKR